MIRSNYVDIFEFSFAFYDLFFRDYSFLSDNFIFHYSYPELLSETWASIAQSSAGIITVVYIVLCMTYL